jgi:hypothetical protein
MPVGEAWRAPAPATIVIEPETASWVLFQHATRAGADHVVALRYGALGERVRGDARDFGAVPRVAHTLDRIDASIVGGIARVTPQAALPGSRGEDRKAGRREGERKDGVE